MRSLYTILTLIVFMTLQPVPSIAQKKIESYAKDIIYFGKGGGFVGFETRYALLASGDLYKKQITNDRSFKFIKRLKPAESRQVFSNYTFLGLAAMELNDPGNIYSFIEFSNKTTKKKLIWGASDQVPGNLKLFYSILIHHLDQ